jgi:hypothetical protein
VNRYVRALAIVALPLSLGGCFGVRVPLPAVNLNIGSGGEAAGNWQRVLRSPRGEPIAPESYEPGMPIVVVWHSRMPAGGTGAAWAGIERECGHVEPSGWNILAATDISAAGGEIYRVLDTGAYSDPRRPAVDMLQAASILGDLRMDLSENLRWLAHVPDRRGHLFVQEWGPLDPASGMAVRPCPVRWVALPMSDYIRATRPSARGAAAAAPAALAPPGEDARAAARVLGLIGEAAFDLVRLHQVALMVELGGRLPGGVSPAMAVWLRSDRIARLGADDLCGLIRQQGLGEPALRLWDGEPTIGPAHAPRCR